MNNKIYYRKTPLIGWPPQGNTSGKSFFLKMENQQPTGSFKVRGMQRLCQNAVAKGAKSIVSSSGGNAGLAAAYVGKELGVPVNVIVPETTPPFMRSKIEGFDATVMVHGTSWNIAHLRAQELAKENNSFYVHPFDHKDLWEGHSTIVDEIIEEIGDFDGMVASVGGGGLLQGLINGTERHRIHLKKILSVETIGADSMYQSLQSGRLQKLPSIDSIATSLGALQVSEEAFLSAIRHCIQPVRVTDKDALNACIQFQKEFDSLVEPACGAALTAIYNDEIRSIFNDCKKVVVIVCGGSVVNEEKMKEWKEHLGVT